MLKHRIPVAAVIVIALCACLCYDAIYRTSYGFATFMALGTVMADALVGPSDGLVPGFCP